MEAVAAGQPFDVILMDMQMPELDGYGAASALRGKGYAGPIVALTAHAMAEDRTKCLQAGCSDYVAKPIDRSLLIRTLATYMAPSPAPRPSKPPWIISEPSTFADDPELRPLLDAFVADLPAHVSRLCASLRQSDLTALRAIVHQMKGTGGTFGFMQLTQAAARVEQSIDARHEIAAIQAAVKGLIQAIEGVEGYQPGAEQPPARA